MSAVCHVFYEPYTGMVIWKDITSRRRTRDVGIRVCAGVVELVLQ